MAISEKTRANITIALLGSLLAALFVVGWTLRGYAIAIEVNSTALKDNTMAVNARFEQGDKRLRAVEDAVLVLTTKSH